MSVVLVPINAGEQASADELRNRLVEIADELRALPADGFAAKHSLNLEADACRRQLAELIADHDASLLEEWSGRAGRKGSHSVDNDVEKGKARIVSPMEGGGPQ